MRKKPSSIGIVVVGFCMYRKNQLIVIKNARCINNADWKRTKSYVVKPDFDDCYAL